MEALGLDPAGYDGTYKLVAGRLSLNFINTVSWPHTDRRHDWLSSLVNLRHWATAVDLDSAKVRAADLEAVRMVRVTVTDLLRPLTHGEHPDDAAIEAFNDQLSLVLSRRVLDVTALGWTWRIQEPQQRLLDPILLDAADLAALTDRSRLGHCPSCDWVFYDGTRNGRRRWCDMADCGSRAKSRSYYQRTNH